MDETIYAVDNTVLHIYGTHAGAVMSGNLEKRLITLVNALLHLTNVRLEFGFAMVGGAIAASSSNTTLNQTSFVSNQARGMGDALYVMDYSIVSFNGETTIFTNIIADISGGAIYVAGGSVVSWGRRKTYFIDNLSYLDGGGATIRNGSVASWSGMVSLSYNTCGRHGGAVYATDHTDIAWERATYFFHNTAGDLGGVISVFHGSTVSWRGEITLDTNFAGLYGGGVSLVYCSILSWSGKTQLYDDMDGGDGGVMVVYDHSDVFGSGDTTYARNRALDNAGGILVLGICIVSWSGEAVFACNTAENYYGGALVVYDSSQPFWSGKTQFYDHWAGGFGGVIAVLHHSNVSSSENTSYDRNCALFGAGCILVLETTPYHGVGKQPSLLMRAKTIVEARSLYMTALEPFGVGKPIYLKTEPAVMGMRLLLTSTLAFLAAGVRHLPKIVHLIVCVCVCVFSSHSF